MEDMVTKSLTVTVPAYLWDAFTKRAEEERRPLANMARVILEESLEAPQRYPNP